MKGLDQLVDRAVAEIRERIPAYADADPGLSGDLRAHVELIYTTSISVFGEARTVTAEDLSFMRPPSRRRASQVGLMDFMQAFRVGETVLWEAVCEQASSERACEAALSFATHLVESGGIASSTAASIYTETQRALASTTERIRRDLIEDLLVGTLPVPGPRLDAARGAGLARESDHVVVVARLAGGDGDAHPLRVGATAMANAASRRGQALMAVRHDEVVMVVPMGDPDDDEHLASRLAEVRAHQAQQGTTLSVGLSTVQHGLDSVPDAYREACEACERVAVDGGLVALSSLSAFEYLTSREDPTARRLVPASIAEFIAEDERHGGVLTETLESYVASGLNAAAAAEQLHVHVNTARYRLTRITETTGCDPRSVPDLINLLIGIRLS